MMMRGERVVDVVVEEVMNVKLEAAGGQSSRNIVGEE